MMEVVHDESGRLADEGLALAATLRDNFTPSALTDMARDMETYGMTAAVSDGQMVGFVITKRKHLMVAEILWIAVAESRQNRHIGTTLVETVTEELGMDGVRLIEAKTLSGLCDYGPYVKTRGFWQANGFLPVEEVDPFPGWDPGNPCVIYIRPL